jgi:hypothetical protein
MIHAAALRPARLPYACTADQRRVSEAAASDCHRQQVDGFIDIWTPLLKVSGGLNATFGGTVAGEPLTCDGCHPKDAGLTIMAQTIADRIRA